MPEFLITKMLNHRFEIWTVRCYKNSNIKISILLKTQSKIISFSEDLNTIWYISDSANKFLVGSWWSSSAPNFSIKTGSNHETDSELISSLSICSCDRPNHVACSVSHSLSNRITSFFLLINQRISHQWINFD